MRAPPLPERITALGAVADRARPVTLVREQTLPVLDALAPLLPGGGLRRGSTVAVEPGPAPGTASLVLSLIAACSQAGSWCAAVGLPELGLVAAAGMGVALERLALVPDPGAQWPVVVAALLDAVDVVVCRPPAGIRATPARRLVARARERGSVLIPVGSSWEGGRDLRLCVVDGGWRGLGQGYGHLQARAAQVEAHGRGEAARARRAWLWLPGPTGAVAAMPERAADQAGPPRAERPLSAVS